MEFIAEQKVYFGRGPMEFLGVVTLVEDGAVTVRGVETGCGQKVSRDVKITALQHLHVISEAEFTERTKNEPVFQIAAST